jgi:sarcosine oxidase, subunit beta
VHFRVAIIGGGAVGASAAWHLSQRGVRDVIVLDAAPALGAGSTGRATGGYRAQYATAINVKLSLASRDKLLRFSEEVGGATGYTPVGYLYLASSQDALDALAAARDVQHACGVHEARAVSVDEAAQLSPHANLDGVIGGAWCPSDGTIRPLGILRGYHDAALRDGVTWWFNARVTSITRDASRHITQVHTTRGDLHVDAVINAAGAWAADIASMVEVPLPVAPARRQVAVSVMQTLLPDTSAMTIWTDNAFHFRVRDGRLLCNWPVDDGLATDNVVSPGWLAQVATLSRERIPAMRSIPFDAAAHWTGLYEMSPDKTVILGAHPACPNLWLANGSSGHGVMHSPILGQLLAEFICDGHTSSLDVAELRPTRFEEGQALAVSGLL